MSTDLTGRILIAQPAIGDTRFARSVILVCAHSDEFAMGIILNKPMDNLNLPDLLDHLDVPVEIEMPESLVLDGGPVSAERGFVLHSQDAISEGATLDVGPEICMTATRDMLETLGTEDAPRQSVLALGYTGWGAGQLEDEIVDNAWIIGHATNDLIFGDSYSEKWTYALNLIGVESGRLQLDSGNA